MKGRGGVDVERWQGLKVEKSHSLTRLYEIQNKCIQKLKFRV